MKVDWDAWSTRDLAEEDIVRLILDGTVIKTRLDRKATNISVLAAIGVRRDGQKVLLSIRNMGGESTAAWSQFLADLDARGLRRPEFVIVDGAPGLEAALVALWGGDLPIQRCTVHKHRNLLGHAPKRLHDELSEDYRDMIYADSAAEIETRRKAFLRKWKLKCRAVVDSLEEAGDRLFSFTRLDPSQWKSARTTNAIERLNEEFRRRIKTQTVLPCAETVPMLLWALLASGQIQMRKVDGWETLSQPLVPMSLDLACGRSQRYMPGARCSAISTTFATRPDHANPRVHATTNRIVDEHFAEEKPHLRPLPAQSYDAVLTVERRISQKGMVAVGGNQYSVPDTTRRRIVEVQNHPAEVRIFEDGQLIASHPVLEGKNQRRVDPSHRKPVPAARRMAPAPSSPVDASVACRPLAFYEAVGRRLANAQEGRP